MKLARCMKGVRAGALLFAVALTGWMAYMSLQQAPNTHLSCEEYRAAYLAGFEQTQAMWHAWPLLVFGLVSMVVGWTVMAKKLIYEMGHAVRSLARFVGRFTS